MYESVGYDTYAESNAFANGIEAQEPVKGTISRGWETYEYEDTNEGYELAKVNLKSPVEKTDENLKTRLRETEDIMEELWIAGQFHRFK